MERRPQDYETKKKVLERDFRRFIKIIKNVGDNLDWHSFVSNIPESVKEKLIEEWFILDSTYLWRKHLCDVLEKLHYYDVLGKLLETLYAGQYYSPEIVKAAEAYEKAGKLEDALRLYREGIEKCDPHRIEVYDENTGGYMSAMGFPEHNKEEIEEAVNLVRKCKEKVREIRGRLKREKDKEE